MTKQEIFDKVARHLLKQGQKSERTAVLRKYCSYRGQGGTSCAVGCLIKDEHYNRLLEGLVARDRPIVSALVASGVPVEDEATEDLLAALQDTHDSHEVKEWPRSLSEVAAGFGLSVAAVEVDKVPAV